MSIEQVEPLAGGRVWSGSEAQRLGLVDTLGDLALAVEHLRERIGSRAARSAELRFVSSKLRKFPRLGIGPQVAWLASVVRDPGALDLMAIWCDRRFDPVLAWQPATLRG